MISKTGLCLSILGFPVLGTLVWFALPAPRSPTSTAACWAPSWSEPAVEEELRAGCRQLVDLITSGSADAPWAVGRLRAATLEPALGPAVRSIAHHGLALAYRTGCGATVDPAASALHEACSGWPDAQGLAKR